ncbi:MAG TPA: hypothetical protein PKA06_06335, partial [Gemmatales bacterium]|nr:hypothetical protein [Gemmatales bacterium]
MPLVYYRQRWEDATRQRNRCQHSLNWYSHARLITFLAGLLISLLISVWSGWGGLITAGIFLALFFWLVARYRGLSLEEQAQLSRIGLYQRGIARLEDRWQTESKSKWHQPAPA